MVLELLPGDVPLDRVRLAAELPRVLEPVPPRRRALRLRGVDRLPPFLRHACPGPRGGACPGPCREKLRSRDRVRVARQVEPLGAGLLPPPVQRPGEPRELRMAVLGQRVADRLCRPLHRRRRARHGIEIRRMGVAGTPHGRAREAQPCPVLPPGGAARAGRIGPAAPVERQVVAPLPPCRHPTGQGMDRFRECRLRFVNRPPLIQHAAPARVQSFGGRQPFAERRQLRVAGNEKFRDAVAGGALAHLRGSPGVRGR